MSTSPRRLGKYELYEQLGRGGMADVWKAFDPHLQRYVAIKLLHPNLQSDPSFATRFQREAQLIAALRHPHIVNIHDLKISETLDSHDTIAYMVMDYIEGGTLVGYIHNTSRRGQFPSPSDIVYLFTCLSEAIDYAHQRGMIHRDIKPANILLDKGSLEVKPHVQHSMGKPILTDFGIAKLLGTPTILPKVLFLGTPEYTSPEQAKADGSSIDERSDIYSLGVILYEICTGVLPFHGDNLAAILWQHCEAVPTLPDSINPSITPALSSVIMRSLAKDPAARYPNASSMVEALVEALDTLGPEGLNKPLLPPGLPTLPPDEGPGQQVFVRGETLETRMNRLNRPMSERDVHAYALQILDVLGDWEQQTSPIVHGDIRPANILIGNKDGRAYLVGLQQSPLPGTPGYAPLEQLQGRVDQRFDLYGLAATMHYLLTSRNPRNYPPFAYPQVRMLNPQVSAEMERVLLRALTNDISKRYQSAQEMKRDLDDILQDVPRPIRPVAPSKWVNKWNGKRRRNIALILVPLFLLITMPLAYLLFFHLNTPKTDTGIGVIRAPDGEYIGISDGSFAFDIVRMDGELKRQASEKLKAGDVDGAQALWQSAAQEDTNDAEALIYWEDQRVLTSGYPYVTLVVGTMISGINIGVGRSSLQGAYVAQKEYNDGFRLPNGTQLRLLIANTGNQASYATVVAQQILRAAKADKTIVGVMGWPFSSHTLRALEVLSAAHIPMVSSTSTSVLLTGRSPYFFRVAPPDTVQASAGVRYVEQTLHAKSVALFLDPTDAYSESLGNAFSQQFTADGNSIVATERYTVGKPATIPDLLQDALRHNPDLLYFSGYSSDVSVLMADMPTSGPSANLLVMGGDGLYILGGYSTEAHATFSRLRFVGLAYPDEWDVLGLTTQKPAFFREYPEFFNPGGQPHTSPYGYTRPESKVMLAFDATLVLLEGCRIVLIEGKKSFTPDDLRQALTKITGANAIQGVSGQIAIGPDGNPIDKAVVVLRVSPEGFIQMISEQGRFLKGT